MSTDGKIVLFITIVFLGFALGNFVKHRNLEAIGFLILALAGILLFGQVA